MLAEALVVIDNTGERFYEAELYRRKGELTLRSKVQRIKAEVEAETERCFGNPASVADHAARRARPVGQQKRGDPARLRGASQVLPVRGALSAVAPGSTLERRCLSRQASAGRRRWDHAAEIRQRHGL